MKSVLFLSSVAVAFTVATTTPVPLCAADIVLFDAATADHAAISTQDGAKFSLANGLVTVTTSPSEGYPGVCIAGKWDLSRYGRIEVEFVNGGINGQYTLRLLNPGGNPGKQIGSRVFKLPIRNEAHAVLGTNLNSSYPKNLTAIAERLKPLRVWALPFAAGVPYEAFKSRKAVPQPGIGRLDPTNVVQVAIYINQPKLPHTWSVKRIVAKEEAKPLTTGTAQAWTKLSEKEFFPFLDKYGQFRHKDWPDKVHSDADFARQRVKEEKDLAAHPGPKGWDKWGGWADGPQLPKTGGFSMTKWNGKWWIVDPDGHLWWSHGPVRVLPSSAMTPLATPAGDRSGWFTELPKRDDPVFGAFYETRDELLWPYYGKRGIDKVYDFSAANIRRKYGEKWFETWADLAHRRLRSWSCNTIANSSDKRICLMDRTPYTERFEIHARPIAGHKGGWWEFCDPFDPSFRAEARRMTEVYKAEIDDPWCFGFFVDNEHHWGGAHTFGVSTLKSPADQPCKAVFRDRLKAKYSTVEKLNAAWGMAYTDWDDFLRVTKEPKSFKGAKADLEAFSSEIAETYFRIIREELKRANPGKLYLGCRWAGSAPAFTVKAAAKYCDILSYNVYRKEMSGFKLPERIDAPVMIGEFHFGALDRGPFCPGLILLRDQKHRAETYKEYVRTSLEHPQIVGVHWHQFSDQTTSGRFDGENMQVGWTDVCDTPYWETVAAVREIGAKMYEIRAGRPDTTSGGIASGEGGRIGIRSDYPGGNVKVVGIDEAGGVVRIAPDLRDTKGNWFHWDFTLSGAAGRTLRFQFPKNGFDYLPSLGPAISRDGGKSWRWFNANGRRHKPKNVFDYTFGADENETRFAMSIPYSQKDWDAASVRWQGKDGVKFDVLCKSQNGRRDTELLRIPCRKGNAKWLFAFTARHHACETTANPVMEGIIDEILSGSHEGEWVRDNVDCVFVPFMDKDGVEDGDQGKNRSPHDHNRDYMAGIYTSVRAWKALLVRESHGKRIVFFDLHSPHVRSHPSCPEQDCAFTFESSNPWHNAHINAFRRNWAETAKNCALAYDGKNDIKAGKGYSVKMEKDRAAGLMTSRQWAESLVNCWMSACCEFGYSLCNGIYSHDGGRELGGALLKAVSRTVESPAVLSGSVFTDKVMPKAGTQSIDEFPVLCERVIAVEGREVSLL